MAGNLTPKLEQESCHDINNAASDDDVFKYALEYYSVETHQSIFDTNIKETWDFISTVHPSIVTALFV